jgi:hypothetical protein
MPIVLNGTTGVTTPSIDTAAGNADLTTLSVAGNEISAVNSLGFRNRLINSDMRIDQRNAGAAATATDGGYQIDRYQTFTESADGVFTVQRVADAPAGFINSAKITVTTADASIGASQRYLFVQNIEGFNVADLGFGAAGASVVTVSFWAKASVTGSFGGSLSNGSFNRTYPFSYVINSANTWEYKTVTITGDTSGTWGKDNGVGVRVMFGVGVGSGNVGPANAWAGSGFYQPTGSVNLISTLNATLNITGVQLEAGSVATPFERRPYGTELQLCQRYFRRISSGNASTGGIIGMGAQTGTNAGYAYVSISQPMRTTPTIAINQLIVSDSANFDTPVSVGGVIGTQDSIYLDLSYASSGAQYRPINLRAVTGNTSGRLDMNAEL